MAITRRQKEVIDFLSSFTQKNGYSPSYEEIASGLGLSSLATVHKHITNLQHKGLLQRAHNRSRSIDVLPTRSSKKGFDRLPLLGRIAAGKPVEAIETAESISLSDIIGNREVFALEVRGDSMRDEPVTTFWSSAPAPHAKVRLSSLWSMAQMQHSNASTVKAVWFVFNLPTPRWHLSTLLPLTSVSKARFLACFVNIHRNLSTLRPIWHTLNRRSSFAPHPDSSTFSLFMEPRSTFVRNLTSDESLYSYNREQNLGHAA